MQVQWTINQPGAEDRCRLAIIAKMPAYNTMSVSLLDLACFVDQHDTTAQQSAVESL